MQHIAADYRFFLCLREGKFQHIFYLVTMFWRIGPCIGLQSDSILLTDGGGGVFMVLGIDGGGRY